MLLAVKGSANTARNPAYFRSKPTTKATITLCGCRYELRWYGRLLYCLRFLLQNSRNIPICATALSRAPVRGGRVDGPHLASENGILRQSQNCCPVLDNHHDP